MGCSGLAGPRADRNQAARTAQTEFVICDGAIENRLHRVRDVTYDEDRLHGRWNGPVLAWGRDVALALLHKAGFRYLPDGFCYLSAHLDVALRWITQPWEN